ncbi:MAG: hypothetical protein WD070_09080 [Pirellulaceae bacterium]
MAKKRLLFTAQPKAPAPPVRAKHPSVAKKRRQKRQPARQTVTIEDRRAEIVTVAWMLAMMTTLGAEVVGGLLRVLVSVLAPAPPTLVVFPNVMLFTAAVTGLICLALTPIVYRSRRVPPPTAVTVLAVTVSVLPLAIGIVQSIR